MHRIGFAAKAVLTLSIVMPCWAVATAEEHPHLTPNECPLRKAGINPHDLKPFEEVEKYTAFLERTDRAKRQKPDAVVKALGLQGDEVLADLGAGSGYFSFRFAKAVPRGRVYALDTQAEMVRHIHHKAMIEGVSNVQAQISKPDDPALPSGADVVFVCDVLHHVKDRPAWLKKIHDQTPSEAKLVLIEFKSGKLPKRSRFDPKFALITLTLRQWSKLCLTVSYNSSRCLVVQR